MFFNTIAQQKDLFKFNKNLVSGCGLFSFIKSHFSTFFEKVKFSSLVFVLIALNFVFEVLTVVELTANHRKWQYETSGVILAPVLSTITVAIVNMAIRKWSKKKWNSILHFGSTNLGSTNLGSTNLEAFYSFPRIKPCE